MTRRGNIIHYPLSGPDVTPGGGSTWPTTNPCQVATVEELLRACLYEQEALRRVLVRKGLLTNEEVLEEVKMVRQELEGKRGAVGREQCTTILGRESSLLVYVADLLGHVVHEEILA
ncbi:MAG: hypothetical protein FVQ06_01105 [candidate division NC10 bacterium]|nr:hypothetical protein [candidate division NC10 bacterium]